MRRVVRNFCVLLDVRVRFLAEFIEGSFPIVLVNTPIGRFPSVVKSNAWKRMKMNRLTYSLGWRSRARESIKFRIRLRSPV